MTDAGALLLAGGGHTHALLLKRWAMKRNSDRRKDLLVTAGSTLVGTSRKPA